MFTKFKQTWFYAAGIRAIKTFAQTVAASITVGAAFSDITWGKLFSIAAVAAFYSVLMSLNGLPETSTDGSIKVNTTNPEKDVYRLELDDGLDTLAKKGKVTFKVRN